MGIERAAARARDLAADKRDRAADKRDSDAENHAKAVHRRAAAADKRDTVADERDTVADKRDTVADERDLVASRRDTVADERDSRSEAEAQSAHLAAIVASSDDAIIAKTLAGAITSWNPAAERMYGYTAAEALGQHINLLCPSSEQEHEVASILQRVADGQRIDHFVA